MGAHRGAARCGADSLTQAVIPQEVHGCEAFELKLPLFAIVHYGKMLKATRVLFIYSGPASPKNFILRFDIRFTENQSWQ